MRTSAVSVPAALWAAATLLLSVSCRNPDWDFGESDGCRMQCGTVREDCLVEARSQSLSESEEQALVQACDDEDVRCEEACVAAYGPPPTY